MTDSKKEDIPLEEEKLVTEIKVKTKEDLIDISKDFGSKDLSVVMSNWLIKENIARSERYSKAKSTIRFYPSSIGKCQRQNVYQMLGYIGMTDNAENLLVLENGTSFHERMEKIFEEMGILIAPELSIKNEMLSISGRSDAIIWNPTLQEGAPDGPIITLKDTKENIVYQGPNNIVSIVEFKSIKDAAFHKLTKSKPKSEHMKQLQLYFRLTGIEHGYIYYENKNTQAIKIYEVFKDDDVIREVVLEIKETVAYAEKGELPERPFEPADIQCRFCNFRNICHPNSNPYNFSDIFADLESKDSSEKE